MNDVRDTWVIARREFVERVHSKWFLVMTILWPILMLGMLIVPALLGGGGTEGAKVAVIDKTKHELGETMAFQLGATLKWKVTPAPADTSEVALRTQIRSHEINGYVMIPEDALDGGEIIYSGDNASNQMVTILFAQVAQSVVLGKRAKLAGLDELQLISLMRHVNVSVRHTTGEEQGSSGIVTFFLGYMLAMGVYMMITLYGFGVMRSVVTEKSSRVVELLVAATKPKAMMSGKIIGVGLAGLSQIAVWVILGGIAIHFRDDLLGLFGASSSGSAMPSMTMSQMAVVLGCFVLGYLFYSAIYAAVGAMVSSEQDTQQAQLPVTFLLIIAMASIISVANDPRGQTATVMTNVPFWSPILMPMRYFLGGATGVQVGISLGILAVSTIVVARAAAKIYRVGILMYGKRPTLRELVRWLRY
jgi:ABC-2 type transport system permease protein